MVPKAVRGQRAVRALAVVHPWFVTALTTMDVGALLTTLRGGSGGWRRVAGGAVPAIQFVPVES